MLGSAAVRFQVLVSRATRWLGAIESSLSKSNSPSPLLLESAGGYQAYEPLQKVILTDQVSRTLFQEYAHHRSSAQGDEETGWDLLGLRERDHAVVLATLPAGTRRDAGVGHVLFNSAAQALAFRILRQQDKRLVMLGVAHTHPGSLRHPSDGDFQGDSTWVGKLRGQEGVFAIGTADGPGLGGGANGVAQSIKPNTHALANLVFSWYVLGTGDRQYRPVDVHLTIGPDLAFPLHAIWPILEEHAEPLDRLCRQQKDISFSVVPGRNGPSLAVSIKLADPGTALRIVLDEGMASYYLQRGAEFLSVTAAGKQVEEACYLILADLAGRCTMR